MLSRILQQSFSTQRRPCAQTQDKSKLTNIWYCVKHKVFSYSDYYTMKNDEWWTKQQFFTTDLLTIYKNLSNFVGKAPTESHLYFHYQLIWLLIKKNGTNNFPEPEVILCYCFHIQPKGQNWMTFHLLSLMTNTSSKYWNWINWNKQMFFNISAYKIAEMINQLSKQWKIYFFWLDKRLVIAALFFYNSQWGTCMCSTKYQNVA